MDSLSFRLANRLLDNSAECGRAGNHDEWPDPEIQSRHTVALSGAAIEARLDGEAAALHA